MVALSFTRSLVLLALGFTHQAAAACTRSVTAKSGDTCATLAAQAGITVTQFLRSNPSVTSCSQLVVGGSYCVEGTADSAPSASSAAPVSTAPAGLQVSTDGSCGQGVTCSGSRFGSCCSAHGFCGSTDDYCGEGCQAGFGSCGGGAGETSQPPAGSVTVTVTTITAITRTSLVYQTSTVTNVVTQTRTAGTATVTRTVSTTATVQTTAMVPATATSIVRLTSIVTSVKTSTTTSTSIKTSTSVTTRTVNVTSLSIDTITSIVTSTRLVTSAACNTTPTRTTGRVTTTTQAPGSRPTLPGTPSNCRNYDLIEGDDTCRSIATRNNLTLLDFYALNPSVSSTVLSIGLCTPDLIELVLSGLCQINCDALWEGYYVCVGR